MDNECNCSGQCMSKHPLKDIEGEKIISVEVIEGDSRYCNMINMKLSSGKHLQFENKMDITQYGIFPRIEYRIGSWGKCDTKQDVPGQLLFDFTNKC